MPFKHGYSKTPIHRTWCGMMTRCFNPSDKKFHLYGGRGITVCERWRKSFENFLADMGEKPGPEFSLDRYPDPNGNYEPGNCRWATLSEQARGKRCLPRLEYEGKTYLPIEIVELTGKSYTCILNRIHHGWSISEVINGRPRPSRKGIKLKPRAPKPALYAAHKKDTQPGGGT